MKNIVCLLFGVLVITVSVKAQHIFSGMVSDSGTGEKLVGAVVSIDNTMLATTTDIDGRFKLKLKDGEYKVSFSLLGYKTQTTVIAVPKDSAVQVKLAMLSVYSDEVVVSSTRAGEKTPTAYTNVGKAYLAKNNLGQDMPYLLSMTPSMVVTSDAGTGTGYTYMHLRGSDASRINVTIDGIPINDAEDQGVYWVDIPDIASSTDNIQIQRGVGTSTNGAGAFGGSINIETTKLSAQPYAEVSSSAGSFNTFKNTFSAGTGLLDGHWAFDARASKITSDGYVDRGSSNFESAFFDGAYYSKKTMLKFIAFTGREKTYQAWYGCPQDSLNTNRTFNPAGMYYDANGNLQFYPNETDNYTQDYFQLHLSQQIGTRWELNAALFQTNGKGYYEDMDAGYDYSSFGLSYPVYGTDTVTTGNFVEQLWLNNNFYGATYSLKYNNHNGLDASVGGAWDQYYGQHYNNLLWAQNGGIPTPPYTYVSFNDLKTDYNIFARANYRLTKKISLYGDVQYRHINYSFYGYNDSLQSVNQDALLGFFNPKGGISFDLSPTQNLYASAAVGNKEPSVYDYTQSSPTSRPLPESMVDYEAGYKQHWKNAAIQVNLYYMDYKNQLVLNGQVNNVGAYNRINVPVSYREGIEFIGGVNITKWLNWELNATYSMNKIKNFNEYVDYYDSLGNYSNILYKVHPLVDISFSPDLIVNSIITVTPVKNLSFSILSKYVSSQYLDNTASSDRMIPSYFVHNVRVSYALHPKFMKEIDLTLLVNNITSLKYVSNGYTYYYLQQNTGGSPNSSFNSNYFFPQALISVLGGVSLKF